MAAEISMPFITGPVPSQSAVSSQLAPPKGELFAISPLSKVQEVLWLDYVRRPWTTHYSLTLKVDMSQLQISLEDIQNHIHRLGCEHAVLRATFHLDDNAENMSQSYMAIHDEATSFQKVEIVTSEEALAAALRQPIDLSREFPVKWVVHQQQAFKDGRFRSSYVVYAVGHHIAVDGASMSVLSQQLLAIKDDLPVEQHRPTYGQFVLRSQGYLKSSNAAEASKFWLSQVKDTVAHDWLHTSPAKPETGDYRQIDTWAFFPNDELKAWSNLYRTSWFRVATAAIGATLTGFSKASPHHDHTLQVAYGAREARFGTTVSHMANTMPVRQPLSELLKNPDSTFADLVKQVGKSVSVGKKHEMYPYMSLLEAARAEAGEDGNTFPSGKVVVTYSPKLADDRCTIYPVQGVWDLFFCFLEHDNGASLGVISDPKVFDAKAVQALKTSFMETIRLSQQKADFKLLSLPYLQNRGVGAILNGPDILDIEAVNKSRVPDWFSQRAALQPDALALSNGETQTSMTYAELEAESDSRALYLQQHGTKRGDVVVLHMDRSFNTVVWILAVLKAGACFTILDKALPLARKQAILRVAEAQSFVTDLEEAAFFADCAKKPEVINLWTLTDPAPGKPEPIDAQPSDLAYIIFTSGSTGTPKAIMVEHQNLSSYVSATRVRVPIGPGSRVLQFASFAFDASILEWAVTLSYGATMCFVNNPSILVDDYLVNMIELNQINFFHTTPSVLSTIPLDKPLESLKMLSVGGEAANVGLLDKWSKRVRLIHAYGPTETTVICATEIVDPASGRLPQPSNIGSSNINTTILICPENSEEELEKGETGEICIAGPQVSRGYRGQPELTEKCFRTVDVNGKAVRMYRSGDRGFLSKEDGKLHILGRMNNREVKVRGYRMDLGVIEKSILDHCDDVRMVTVQVVNDSLACLVVPETVSVDSIRDKISKDLPSYSVPGRFLAIKKLPLNINGKVDHKKALEEFASLSAATPAPSAPAASAVQNAVQAPSASAAADARASKVASIEGVITSLWQEILHAATPVGLDTTFYDAGGHSLLLSVLHKKLLVEYPSSKLSLLDVFHNPTIRRQAARLADLIGDDLPMSSTVSTTMGSLQAPYTPARSVATSVSNMEIREDRFAIVGMAGRFPGANNVDKFWELLMAQKDGVATSDGSGAKDANLQPGEIFVPRYGSIEGIEAFKGKDWSMTDDEVRALDPQKRLFIIVAQEAFKDAGIEVRQPGGTHSGTFVGIAHNTWHGEVPKTNTFESRYRVVLDPNASTFTAFKLNLTGPSLDINTACASSLVALHQAIGALQAGECKVALVGGSSIAFPALGGYATADGKIFSASGECRPLDARCDGSVPADGVAAAIIKPLSAAKEDGDRIYAVIEGHATGTDGSIDKIGFTVPSSSGQTKVVRDAILSSGVNPAAIRYVEMHGSGTSVGDALEFQGLKQGFAEAESAFQSRSGQSSSASSVKSNSTAPSSASTPSTRSGSEHILHVGSNKGNFGNSEACSGMFSLIKASMALTKGVMPPLRQLGELNSLIDTNAPIRPLREHMKLNASDRIGITSLGYGGVNAHIILSGANAGPA